MLKQSIRHAYGACLAELGKEFPQLMVLEADLKESTQSIQFEKAFPERYIECGIAEQNMVCVAAGLALTGKIPVAHSFACFLTMRACEQVRTSVAYPRLNVKLVASHAGITAGTAGTTHHATEDMAIMRAIANMVVLAPGDAAEMRQVFKAALAYDGPVYMRLGAADYHDVYTDTTQFQWGKATLLRQGKDATIITTGSLMYEGLQAAEQLKKDKGLDVRVLQMAFLKPFDTEAVVKAARETKFIITLEEHNIIGGLGSAAAEAMAEAGCGKLTRMGIKDHFCGIGSHGCLMQEEGLTIGDIVRTVCDGKKA